MGTASSKPTMTNAVEPIEEKAQYLADRKAAATRSVSHDTEAIPELNAGVFNKWDKDLEQDARFQLARLILTNNDPIATLKRRTAVIEDEKVFNVNLKGVDDKGKYPGPRVNQASSGRCWLFATTNVLRYNVIEQLKLGDFQLSQSYLYFYDKLEKANYYLETILDLADEPIDGRLLSFLNQAPVNDGGQWDMAYNIVAKYGIIPHSLYPDAYSATASSRMNWVLTAKLREFALDLRKAASEGQSKADLAKLKASQLRDIYSTLCITLGTPPKNDETLTWEYYDKDNAYHSWSGTPLEFYAQFGKRKGMDPKDSFSLINDPRNRYEQLYTVKRLGNVWGGPGVRYVNAPASVLEDAVIAGIKANTPLFFGCDVGKFSESKNGIMDTELYDLGAAFGYELKMDKAQRLIVGESSATHAMVITAVHVGKDGRPTKYKVENSWSKDSGEEGWFMMTAEWFREFVYQVVVPRSIVDKKWVKVLDQKPVELEPWDPMGALA